MWLTLEFYLPLLITDDPCNYQTTLPAATTYGANIFACYVDGKPYIANTLETRNEYL